MKSVRGQLTSSGVVYKTSTLSEDEVKPLGINMVRLRLTAAAVKPANFEMLKFISAGADDFTFPGCTDFCGKVTSVGADVTRVVMGDVVCGIISPLSPYSACADSMDVHEFDLVKLPSSRTDTDAAACIGPGVKAYTAMVYHASTTSASTVVIMAASSADGYIAVQLALSWNAKVIACVSGDEERGFLEKNQPNIAQIVDLGSRNTSLSSAIMEETGSLGADLIIDNGVALTGDSPSEGSTPGLTSKHEIVSSLAVHGRWITSHPNLQLDPPDSMILYMKNASISFLFESSWTLSHAQQGRYLHILTDLMDKLASGTIRSHVSKTVQFADSEKVLGSQSHQQIGCTVMYMN